MIKVGNIETWGFEYAVRGMRNPMNSWNKSDSNFETNTLGENDLALMKKLCKAGSEHRKFMRQIFVSMDITAPLYWWKEFDTYKVGTAANSCSTMHKIADKEFTLDDFSWEQLLNTDCDLFETEAVNGLFHTLVQPTELLINYIIPSLNVCREGFIKTKDKKYWWQMIQLLPSSYNQRRTVTMNYEVAYNIINQRTGHKLDEWNNFVDILINDLPYMDELYQPKTEPVNNDFPCKLGDKFYFPDIYKEIFEDVCTGFQQLSDSLYIHGEKGGLFYVGNVYFNKEEAEKR